MKPFSKESFIKKALTSNNLFSLKRSQKTLGSLIIVFALAALSGAITLEAQAPTEEEAQAFDAGFSSEVERTQALEKLAAEIKRLNEDKVQILWLARVLYSETKRPEEMPYIAWVVRNRVEMGHRAFDYEAGENSYKGAALARSQFSGMHPHLDRNAYRNLAMDYSVVGVPAWDNAVRIASTVYYSDGSDRLLDPSVTHFYSPTVIAPPNWAVNGREVYRFSSNRFAFYNVLGT